MIRFTVSQCDAIRSLESQDVLICDYEYKNTLVGLMFSYVIVGRREAYSLPTILRQFVDSCYRVHLIKIKKCYNCFIDQIEYISQRLSLRDLLERRTHPVCTKHYSHFPCQLQTDFNISKSTSV